MEHVDHEVIKKGKFFCFNNEARAVFPILADVLEKL